MRLLVSGTGAAAPRNMGRNCRGGVRCAAKLLSSLLVCAALVSAGPVDFALAELNAAMAERKIRAKNLVELSLDPPETFRIEPYKIGGAHITGGDLRGLMYALLEAAAQIRATGRFDKVTAAPAASLRGVRIVMDAELEQAPAAFWPVYFHMLARNRFNRVHVVFPRLRKPFELPQFLSHTAAEYGIDFTLGVSGPVDAQDLAHLLTLSPAIRGVAPEAGAAHEPLLSAMRAAGRRVTLDPDTATLHPKILGEALSGNLSLLRANTAWPPSFEIAPPIDPKSADAHPLFYEVAGKLSYDPKGKPPQTVDAAEYTAAHGAVLWLAAAQQSAEGGSDYVASPAETARNRDEHVASAKFTPADIAANLYAAAARLGQSSLPDFQLLGEMARTAAGRQIAAANFPPLGGVAAPTAWTYDYPLSTPSEQPLTISFRLIQPNSVSAVRLHYRTLDPAAPTKTIEMPAAAEITFTIPAADITGNWDLLYFFEILHASGNGWFEPDPLTVTPYRTVHVIAPHTGRN